MPPTLVYSAACRVPDVMSDTLDTFRSVTIRDLLPS
jgi:hypothetical protein